jgi:hypothetical protein
MSNVGTKKSPVILRSSVDRNFLRPRIRGTKSEQINILVQKNKRILISYSFISFNSNNCIIQRIDKHKEVQDLRKYKVIINHI